MKKLIVGAIAAVGFAASGAAALAANISGAGATFPAPVYAKWAEAYKASSGNALNYQAIGSGGGHQADRGQDRRLRRLRQAAEAGGPEGQRARCSFPPSSAASCPS